MRGVILVVLAGCWSTPRPAAPPAEPPTEPPPRVTTRTRVHAPSHCERAIDHVVGVMQPQLDSDPLLKARQQLLRDAAVEACVTTGWSEDTLICYDEIVDPAALVTCFSKLTDDQRTDFNQRMTDTMKQPVP